MRKLLILIPLLLCGCSALQVKTPHPVVLQEDRVYTLPAGQEVNVEFDHKPMKLTFPEPMKITTIDHILKEEKMKDNAVLDKSKADKSRNKWVGILGSLLALGAGGSGVLLKYGKGKKK